MPSQIRTQLYIREKHIRPCTVSSTMPLYTIIVAKKVLGRVREAGMLSGFAASAHKKNHI